MKLKKGQIISIKAEKYTVVNMIEYLEGTWIWQEYEIKEINSYKSKWLSVEEDENNKTKYYLYEKYEGNVSIDDIEFQSNGKTYELYEKGIQTVNSYFGNVDVDKYENCEYFDYQTKDGKSIISVEKWEDESEKSIGVPIDDVYIQITNEIDTTVKQTSNNIKSDVKNKQTSNNIKSDINNKKTNSSIFGAIFFAIIFLPMIFSMFSGMFVNKSIQKYLKKEKSKYTYVTSVTNNTNKEKAKVYESKLGSIDATVKDIIDGVPEGINKTTGNEGKIDDGIGIQTNKEYAFVYRENQKVYIQVSNKKYLNNSGTMYHSNHHGYYHSYYSRTRPIGTYSNYAYSARQKSVNSRSFSGGGTSSGK